VSSDKASKFRKIAGIVSFAPENVASGAEKLQRDRRDTVDLCGIAVELHVTGLKITHLILRRARIRTVSPMLKRAGAAIQGTFQAIFMASAESNWAIPKFGSK